MKSTTKVSPQLTASLRALLPHISADTVALNPHLSDSAAVNPNPKQNDSTGNVERIKGKRGGHCVSMPGEPYYSDGKPGRHGMNKTESEFSLILEAMKRKGEILRYEFEGITLRFAGVKYTPDFVVFQKVWLDNIDWEITKFIEVKGPFIKGNRERAVERFRHAKTYWPEFTFEMHQKTHNGWKQII